MRISRTWRSRRRRQILGALVLVAAFGAALTLWAGGDDSDSALSETPSTSITPVDPNGSSGSGTTPSPSASNGTLPALPGFGNVSLPNRTDLTTLGPGEHRVVLTARSDSPMLAVAYSLRGDKSGKTVYNVKSPVTISRTFSGGGPYAAIVLQVSNVGTRGSCSVTVDGKVADSRSINKPYAVMGCTA